MVSESRVPQSVEGLLDGHYRPLRLGWRYVSFNSISSYFDKLLEADTVGVRAIPLLQVLLGIHLNSPPF
jgi:hypothetical protein